MLRSAIPGQQWSSTTGPSTQRPSVRPYEETAGMSYTSYAPQSSGYGTHVPSAPSAEALRKQQEEFVRNAELRQILANLEQVNDEGRRTSLLDTLCSTEDVLNLPEHPNPPGIASGELRVDLLKHQVCDYSIMQGAY